MGAGVGAGWWGDTAEGKNVGLKYAKVRKCVMRVVDWEPEGLKKRSWCQEPWGTDWSWNHSLCSFRLYLEQPREAKTGAVEGFAVARLCLF